MKQHITKNQWDELSGEEQKVLCANFRNENGDLKLTYCSNEAERKEGRIKYSFLPTIGQMIEFLGDDYHKALLVSYYIANDEYVPTNEICDTLWEAVKYKLRNI